MVEKKCARAVKRNYWMREGNLKMNLTRLGSAKTGIEHFYFTTFLPSKKLWM
jgi:hypothetical protein